MDKVFIVIEGIADEKFLSQLIAERIDSKHEIKFIKAETNGTSIKQKRIDQIRAQTADLDFKTLFILDADAPDFTKTKDSLIENFSKEGIVIADDHIFLLPNNLDNGCLENLLIGLVTDKAEPIFTCFETYKECIHQIDESYTKPDLKTKMYAYSEIITSSGSERDRNYRDSGIWNLYDASLTPLVDFLTRHLS